MIEKVNYLFDSVNAVVDPPDMISVYDKFCDELLTSFLTGN